MLRISSLARLARDDDASATIGGIFFTVAALGVSGLALDQANAWRVQTQLQTAADAAAAAAATQITDFEAARTLAIGVAELNLSRPGVIDAGDVVFGTWDAETAQFLATEDPEAASAVQVSIDLTKAGGDAIPTYLLRFAGLDHWDIGAMAIAGSSEFTISGGTQTAPVDCSATFLSTGHIDTGGGNELSAGVCIHGKTGVHTGGGDWYDATVRLSSESLSDVTVNTYGPTGLTLDQITAEAVIAPTILPELDSMWGTMWSALYESGAASYSGPLLPDFIYDGGAADIVVKEGWWSIQPGDVQPNTIYVVNGGAQFSGGIDAQNVAFIVNGYFGVGGGFGLNFDDVFIFAADINLAGNITWGPTNAVCGDDHAYSVYLFGRQTLSMGGWGAPTPVNHVIGASPRFSPGGAMTGSEIYFEFGSLTSDTHTSLGGDLNVQGSVCDVALASFMPLADMGSQEEPATGETIRMSRLYR